MVYLPGPETRVLVVQNQTLNPGQFPRSGHHMSLTLTPGDGYFKEREVCLERSVLANSFRHGGKKVYGVIVAKQ